MTEDMLGYIIVGMIIGFLGVPIAILVVYNRGKKIRGRQGWQDADPEHGREAGRDPR